MIELAFVRPFPINIPVCISNYRKKMENSQKSCFFLHKTPVSYMELAFEIKRDQMKNRFVFVRNELQRGLAFMLSSLLFP